MPERRGVEPTARTVLRSVLIVVLVIAVLYVAYLLRKPLGWLVIAAFVAVALSGPVNLLSRWMNRRLAIALAYVGLLLIPVGIGGIIVPPVVREGTTLVEHLPEYVQDVQDTIDHNATLREFNDKYGITQSLEKRAKQLPGRFGEAANTLQDVGSGIVSSVFAALNILFFSIFMLASGRRWIDRALAHQRPDHAERIGRALDRISIAIGNYVAGAFVQATIAGVTAFIVLSVLGIPFAGPLAVLVGLFDLLPLVGATIAAVLVSIVTLFNDFPTATIVWVVWSIIYQQVENTLIQPQIQRRAVEIHPFGVLISVLFGATLFGIVGALLAIPVAASLQIAAREWWEYRRETAIVSATAAPAPGGSTGPGR